MAKVREYTGSAALAELLDDWNLLNGFLMSTAAGEEDVQRLLELEKRGRKRHTVLARIHSNYARKRYLRERAELSKLAGR